MVHPILLDARTDYMAAADHPASLLLAPVGGRRLISVVCDAVGTAARAPSVVSVFEPGAEYESEIRRAHPPVGAVRALRAFRPLEEFEASEWLLFVDARYAVPDAAEVTTMLRDMTRSRLRAAHLVAMKHQGGGTRERVELVTDGRVRRIQRYYESATWPFMSAVTCSLVSVAALRKMTPPLEWTSLADLRMLLLLQGVPCRDVATRGPWFDLTREQDLVRLNESVLIDEIAEHRRRSPRSDTYVHPAARVVGPVLFQDGSVVEAGAVVVGPAVVGAGARVGANVVLAQGIVAPGAQVPANSVVRWRAVYGSRGPATPPPSGEGMLPAAIAVDENRAIAVYPRVKAVLDRVLAAIALALLSPLMLALAALIKLDSRGSVFFADLREGQDGRLFRCLKFRTMVTGSDLMQAELLKKNEVDGPQFKLEKDPRLTRLGRWLRPMSIDELPQLINVLCGDMSLIGPRPSPFRENQACVPWRDARLSVRPGITGLWQVCRQDRREGDFHQWIYFDLLYVQHVSFMVDLAILLATILTRGGQTNVRVEWIIPVTKLAR